MGLNIFRVIGFEVSVMGLMKMNDQRHNLAHMQLCRSQASSFTTGELFFFPYGQEDLAEIIDMAEQFD